MPSVLISLVLKPNISMFIIHFDRTLNNYFYTLHIMIFMNWVKDLYDVLADPPATLSAWFSSSYLPTTLPTQVIKLCTYYDTSLAYLFYYIFNTPLASRSIISNHPICSKTPTIIELYDSIIILSLIQNHLTL